jgi:hypothetical protein
MIIIVKSSNKQFTKMNDKCKFNNYTELNTQMLSNNKYIKLTNFNNFNKHIINNNIIIKQNKLFLNKNI